MISDTEKLAQIRLLQKEWVATRHNLMTDETCTTSIMRDHFEGRAEGLAECIEGVQKIMEL